MCINCGNCLLHKNKKFAISIAQVTVTLVTLREQVATELTKQEVQRMDAVSYRQYRSQLETGDLLFASGNLPLSKIIRGATLSPWSHVGLVVRMASFDRVLLLESVLTVGVRFAPMSKYFGRNRKDHHYDGEIVIARHQNIDPNSPYLRALTGWGIDQLTRPYGYVKLIGIAARIAFKFGSVDRRSDAFVCSELVDGCFRRIGSGMPPFPRADPKFVSPADIWSDPLVKPVVRLIP